MAEGWQILVCSSKGPGGELEGLGIDVILKQKGPSTNSLRRAVPPSDRNIESCGQQVPLSRYQNIISRSTLCILKESNYFGNPCII